MSAINQNRTDSVTIVPTGCCHDCGGRCVLRAHVKDGKIIRFETDNGEEPQIRACLRGRAYRQRVYHPDRLKHPLRRVGERGEGKFERVSWDEALDEVTGQLKRIMKTYGNSAIFLAGGSDNQGAWYDPDEDGVDCGGCANVLTADAHSPGGAHHMNCARVQVETSPKN